MKPSIEPWAVRHDRRSCRGCKDKEFDRSLLIISSLFLASVLVYFVTSVFHLTDIAQASSLKYEDVTTMKEACEYVKENQVQIVNHSEEAIRKACAQEGITI